MAADLLAPTRGQLSAVVFRRLDDDDRHAHLSTWDRRWTHDLPLPDDPTPDMSDAVGRARTFLTAATP